MERYTIAQLAAALRVDENTLRRWLERDTVEVQRDRYDQRVRYVARSDAERIAVNHGRELGDVSDLPTTLDGAWREIVKLRADIKQLKAAVIPAYAPVRAYEPILSVPPTRTIDISSEYRYRSARTSSSLPDGMASVEGFAHRHGWPMQTIRKAIESGRLSETRGEWRAQRAIIRHALSRDQQIDMLAMYRSHERFHACDDTACPCYDLEM